MGLFVSTTAFGNGTNTAYGRRVVNSLQLICNYLNSSTAPNRITSLSLDHLTSSSGEYLAETVDVLSPYFNCFDRIYVGTADNHFSSDIYCAALTNKTFTGEWVDRSITAAAKFEQDHPNLRNFHWYLNYEAAGNYFSTGCTHFSAQQRPPPAQPPAVSAQAFTSAYIDMFSTLTKALVKMRNVSVMWSPTFNFRASDVTDRRALLGNVTRFLKGVPLLREVVNQDAMGKYSLYNISSGSFTYNLTCADTIFYQELLSEAAVAAVVHKDAAAQVSVNMELFSRRNTLPKQSTISGDPVEHERRKCCYAANNLTIGPSWDISDWYQANFMEWDPAKGVAEGEMEVPTAHVVDDRW
jgi:hypothetical protein